MQTDTSRTPEDEDPDDDDDADAEDDGGHRFPFDPRRDGRTPLGDTDQHSDANA